ncbi:MAG: hypothetical protein IJZ46_02915 [Bacilli bacterium]|nr:hypothetical protein [Bacilli bacterium]
MESTNNNPKILEEIFTEKEERDLELVFKHKELREIINDCEATLDGKIADKSIGTHKYIRKNVKKSERKKREKKEINPKILKTILACSLIAASLISLGGLKTKIDRAIKVGKATKPYIEAAESRLFYYGLATYNENGLRVFDNSISQYEQLRADEPLEIYIYKQILPENEFDKFIKSASYSNDMYNYISYNQFLEYNGYRDPETNSISNTVFENYMETEILERQNTSSQSFIEEEFYNFGINGGIKK